MGLENLKSVFKNDLDSRIDNFKQNSPGGIENKSNLTNNFDRPILDSIDKKQSLDLQTNTKPATDNPLITFKTAGKDGIQKKPLHSDGITFYNGENHPDNLTWQNLYNSGHTPRDDAEWQGLTPISYPNVNRDKLNIRDGNMHSSIFSFDRSPFLGLGRGEPYVVSEIGSPLDQAGSREVPIIRSIQDAFRLSQFISSPAGLQFTARQNLLGLFSDSESPLSDDSGRAYGILKSPQKYNTFYNPLSSIGAAGLRLVGAQPNVKIRKDVLLPSTLGVDESSYPENASDASNTNLHLTFGNQGDQILDNTQTFPVAAGTKFRKSFALGAPKSGDKHTLIDFGIKQSGRYLEKLEDAHPNDEGENKVITGRKNGMPFYFKDMRDGAFIVFRAYIEGLTENINPSWASHNYIGRSEPVYTYERAEREINFTLKLAAQSPDELEMIYKKMNRLTSLCYPEYASDPNLNDKLRMKPPLVKLRMGEYFGNTNNELMGWLKTLSYVVEQSSTWEVMEGARVPRHVTVTIGYQVIHGTVPSIDTKFYGYVGA
jgi:hypothetical protein